MEEYLTVQQVAALLKMHWQTVLNYIKTGKLEAVRLDKGYRISTEAIQRFMDNRTTKAKEE